MSAHLSKLGPVTVVLTREEIQTIKREAEGFRTANSEAYMEASERDDREACRFHLKRQEVWDSIVQKMLEVEGRDAYFASLKGEVGAVVAAGAEVGCGGGAVAAAGGEVAAAGGAVAAAGGAVGGGGGAVVATSDTAVPSWETVRRSLAAASDALQSVGASRR